VPELSRVEREFAERMALFFEQLGGTRTMGLIYGWLNVCDPPHQSITELANALGISKASVSTVVRQLEQAQMVERVPPAPGSRQHHYEVRAGGWAQIMRARIARLGPGAAAADHALSSLGPDRAQQRERLAEMRDFFLFVETEYADGLARRWEEHRKRTRGKRPAARHG
jgi:DNA-binding MarR family transcriptional regulator